MNGARVKLARDALGWTQAELADAIGVSQQGVCAIEACLYGANESQVAAMALRTPFLPSFFEKPEPPEFPFGSILYRALRRVKHPARTQAHAIAQVMFELALGLSTGLKKIPINLPRFWSDQGAMHEGPAACARLTRAQLGMSPHAPVRNVIRCLERNGVFVFRLPIDTQGFDGFSAWAGRDPTHPVIAMIPEGKTAYRQNFTVAEELGHLVMHFPLRVSMADAEAEAKSFAQEFLLPEEVVREEMRPPITLSGLAALKPRWNVSIKLLAMRAHTLGLTSANQHRYLMQQMSARWATKEPGDDRVLPEQPILLRKMAELVCPGGPIDYTCLSRRSGIQAAWLRKALEVDAQSLDASGATVLPFTPRRNQGIKV